MLIDFKACRIGHPNFEIKLIDFFASNVIRTAIIVQECVLIIIYTFPKSIFHKNLQAYMFHFILTLKRSALHIFVYK